ncbi:MAG: hypothetical protein WCD79_07625 [Chthoniobacteraceae bacterium]
MFVTAGFDELERKLQRAADRVRILLEKRRLTQTEINLGALGWQQVDDFPPEIEEQMREIHAMERQQADLSNQGADIQWEIDALQLKRKENGKNLEYLLAEIEPALQPLAGWRAEAEKSIIAGNESIQRFDKAIADLESAHESFGLRLQALMSEKQTFPVRDQVLWIEERRMALGNEKEDLERSRVKTTMDQKTTEEQIQTVQAQIEELNQKIRVAKEESNARDRELNSQINALEKQKKNASKNVESLDKKKSPAFLAIGRCLADADIAPMNQPEALEHVIAHRGKIAGLEEQIIHSLARSSQVPASTLMTFYVALFLLLAIIAVAIFFLLPRHP